MIRLTVLLCCGLFVTLLIAGEDRGQVREGLKAAPLVPDTAVEVATTSKTDPLPEVLPQPQITEAVFVPAQPVRVVPVEPAPQAEPAVAEPAPAAEPETRLAVVGSRSVNVRSGPSTSDPIIGRLSQDEEVLIVVEASPVEGWSLVRIEGDGITGYVASRLLRDVTP